MSKYNRYARRLDALARQRFSDYEKAVEAYEKAKKERAAKPYINGGWGVTPEMQLEAKKAEVKYLEAEKNYKEAEKAYKNTLAEVQDIRAELLDEVTAAVSVNPEDLDRNTVDLLKSGICSAAEVAELYDKAATATTKRYIAKYAAEEVERNNNSNMDITKRRNANEILNNVVAAGHQYTNPATSETMKTFDSVVGVLTRCINNPSMIGAWASLTADVIESF